MANLKQIETFYWTTKLGTLNRAASKLFITQSAATKRLQELERQSSSPLFEENGQKNNLTAKGREVLATSEDLLQAFWKLDELRKSASRVARTVRMGITELATLTWFTSFVERVKAVYPDVAVHPEVDMSATLQEKLLSGQLDIVVLTEEYLTPAMASLYLQNVDFAWLTTPGSPISGRVVTIPELAKVPIILQGPLSALTIRCEAIFAEAGVDFDRVYGSNSLFALKGLVCAGLGTSCMPKELFQSEIDSGKLEVLVTDPPAPSVKYYAAFMRQNHAALGYAIADLAKKCC
ncbi:MULTISPECIES: LysR family transcriptional regulator [Pseudomonas]|uniref:DNA-binding transcriptional regulator, LysR family n=2 Tax=Pseudomonas TaxID=286 RepID=A0A1H1X3S5_9PSED|nr:MULTISPECIES: LysR family transcriptional regulator [Pseudomonas]MBT2298171.1 LysR family transcriptional regulator [Pseudomonas fluorescens]MBT2309706.1 LysR family transcriptional regulator [Pseudomonas fluorescens]MBT2314869.1 LysR family transcriptional regulator [Pseudomonas fluorescens]MBT2327775.1 LysR family transcriptional regulator [Pseudomonas fluorescens]MBT2345522.1 LysR family transcriptional regulator [Pseudomonas fluorescens]